MVNDAKRLAENGKLSTIVTFNTGVRTMGKLSKEDVALRLMSYPVIEAIRQGQDVIVTQPAKNRIHIEFKDTQQLVEIQVRMPSGPRDVREDSTILEKPGLSNGLVSDIGPTE